jgi:predicted GNAT superfamily acetyltransferase
VAGQCVPSPSCATIEIPNLLDDWMASDLPRVQSVQTAVRKQFTEGFAKGYAAVAVARTADTTTYQLAPWSDF